MGWVGLFVAVLVLGGGWFAGAPGVLLAVGSAVSLGYFLFLAPADCRAEGRKGPCRNNAKGLLNACHIEQHRRQKLWQLVPGRNFRKRVRLWWEGSKRGLWDTPRQQLDTLGIIVSILSGAAAAVKALVEVFTN